MITVVGKLTALLGNEASLHELFMTLAKETRQEKGCLLYVPYVSNETPREVMVYAQYVDQEAYEAHTQSPHFKEHLEKFPQFVREHDNEILDGEVVVHFFQALI